MDALVLSEGTTYPGVVIRARPIAVVELEQNKKGGGGRQRNDRLIAVAATSPHRADVRALRDLSARLREEIERFFLAATYFESKAVSILGWTDAPAALDLVRRSLTKTQKA